MKLKLLYNIFILIFILRCSSSEGFDRGPLPKTNSAPLYIDSNEIRKYLALKPQLRLPFR